MSGWDLTIPRFKGGSENTLPVIKIVSVVLLSSRYYCKNTTCLLTGMFFEGVKGLGGEAALPFSNTISWKRHNGGYFFKGQRDGSIAI